MAGDWIPVTLSLPTRREILQIAAATHRSRHEVLGLIVNLWCWASEESRNGHVDVTLASLRLSIGADEKFWMEVVRAGWLKVPETGGITIPRWERWLGQSAKNRVQATLRKRKQRVKESQGNHA